MEACTWGHELPQLLWHDDALLRLVVLQDGADGPGGGTHCGIKHMDKLHLGRAGSTGKVKGIPQLLLPMIWNHPLSHSSPIQRTTLTRFQRRAFLFFFTNSEVTLERVLMFACVTSRRLQDLQRMWGKEETTSVALLLTHAKPNSGQMRV